MASANYYEIFDIPKNSNQDAIKLAYRKLVHRYHPDKNKGDKIAEQKMKEINLIYSVLSDPHKRKAYDESFNAHLHFDSYDWDHNARQSWVDIYCNELEVLDSTGIKTNIKVGQNVYYPLEVNRSVISLKFKNKTYYSTYVKRIFDPAKKAHFKDVLKYELKNVPICLVDFGGNDLIVYEEDFKLFWLSEKSYKKIDMRRGLVTAVIVIVVLVIGGYYFYDMYQLTPEQRQLLENDRVKGEMISDQEYKEFLREEYKATDGEINYILTEKYETCTKEITKTKVSVEIRNAPDIYAFVNGKIPKNSAIVILLYCRDRDAYKITFENLSGWVHGEVLENPACNSEENNN